jgi:hypothetical protein
MLEEVMGFGSREHQSSWGVLASVRCFEGADRSKEPFELDAQQPSPADASISKRNLLKA